MTRAPAPKQMPSPAAVTIRLLGEASIVRAGDDVSAHASLAVQRLFAALALAGGRPVSRLALAAKFWPESPEQQARTNLRKQLHELRRTMHDVDDLLVISAQDVCLRPNASWVDLAVFVRAVAAGDDVAAAAAYGGELLPDCFDEWTLAERERLRDDAGHVLARLASAAGEHGDHAALLRHASAQLRLDPLNESAHRSVIATHARLGDRAQALAAYHRCADVLDRELGVEPDETTRGLYDALHADAGRPVRKRKSLSLVGRTAELAALRSEWDAAAAGQRRLVLVSGEAGIGKTRLVDALVDEVAPTTTVARARAYESAGRLPWGPVVEWLRAPEMARRVGRLAAGWRAELGALLPELAGGPAATSADPSRRRQLFDALAAALVGEPGPVLLVLDDVQWCDRETLEFVGFLTATLGDRSLLVLGTVRPDEIDETHPLPRVFAHLDGHGQASTLRLGPLSADETAALARAAGAEDASIEAIWQNTGGHPLFVVEAVRAGLSGDPVGALTPTVKSTISGRLQLLGPAARELVDLAATFGRAFTIDELLSTRVLAEPELLDGLDELWRREVVREHDGSYDLWHDKIREVAYEGSGPGRRRVLHDAVGTALLLLYGEDRAHAAEAAIHFEGAGRLAEAVAACSRAAHHAIDVYAPRDAIEQCRHALVLLDRLPATTWRDELELRVLQLLVSVLGLHSGAADPEVVRACERCLALSTALGLVPDAAAMRGLAMAGIVQCDFDRAEHYGAELAGRTDDPVAHTEGEYLQGVAAFWRGDLSRSASHLQRAIDSYDEEYGGQHRALFALDPRAVCLSRLALTRQWQDDVEGARALIAEAITYAQQLRHPPSEAYVRVYACFIATEVDDRHLLRDNVTLGQTLWDEHELAFVEHMGLCLPPWLGVLDGEARAYRRLSDLADAGADDPVATVHYAYVQSLLGRAALLTGRLEEGLVAVRRGISWGEDRNQRYAEALLRRIEGELLAACGETELARSAWSMAIEVANAQGAAHFGRTAAELLARGSVD
ncbi:MAG: ATP-binding protein [Marmoricola sp.]